MVYRRRGNILDTLRVAVEDWRSNVVRIPLFQARWFEKAEGQTDGGKAYRALVKQAVDRTTGLGAYAMLDLHGNNAGEWGENIGQHKTPDMLSLEFWKDCAKAYKNQPGVMFDLYNETHDLYFTEADAFIVRPVCDGYGGSGEYTMSRDTLAAKPYALGTS